MRAVVLVSIAACAGHEAAPRPIAKRANPIAPGPRLPADAAPLGYDLRLEVDPDSDAFRGEVRIQVRVRGSDHVWLHASGLAIGAAHRGTRPAPIVATGDEMIALDLGEVITGDIELAIPFSGHTGADEEGLFRQLDRGRWYLYSQAESVFARRFVPCFDEPRFKVPWRVAIVAPADLAVLANAPEVARTLLPDGRREVRFAETPPLPSFLLALAVGPFAIVDAGHAGKLPLRAVVLAGDADRAGIVATQAPALIAALEAYTGSPLPWPKLDFVAVPHLFGAMENPGLITFDRDSLVGDAGAAQFRAHFVRIAGHELAHMWFGNSVTPAWWDDLWLAEAFAQWAADWLASELHAFDDEPLQRALARERALAADDAIDARPLHHTVATGADAEGDFDAISYEKGAALLASFERVAGAAPFQRAIRAYLAAHAGGSATTADLVATLAHETTPAIAHGLATDIDRAGAPVVRLRCDTALVAEASDGVVPLCYRTGTASGCMLVADRASLPGSCDAIANAGGLGYYAAVDLGARAAPRSPAESIAHGDDIAAALRRGALDAAHAAAELRTLAAGDVYAQLGAIAIARALAAIAEPVPFATWLATRFAARLTPMALLAPPTAAERALRDALLELAALPALPGMGKRLDDALARDEAAPLQIAIVAPSGGRALFDRVLASAGRAHGDSRDALLESLGTFGPDLAPHAIELVAAGALPLAIATAYLERPLTRAAAWRAIRARLAQLVALATPPQAKQLVTALAALCDARAEVAAALAPHIPAILDGERTLARTLATIDRCRARRAAAGRFAP